MTGQLSRMPSTVTLTTTFLGVSVGLLAMVFTVVAALPTLKSLSP